MSNQTYRGRIKGGSVVLLDEPAALPDGTCVIVTVMKPQPGTPADLQAALNEVSPLTKKDAEEIQRALDEGCDRRSRVIVFWDEAQTPEAFQAALAGGPQVTDEDVDEWERAIAEGKRPRSRVDLLDESQTP